MKLQAIVSITLLCHATCYSQPPLTVTLPSSASSNSLCQLCALASSPPATPCTARTNRSCYSPKSPLTARSYLSACILQEDYDDLHRCEYKKALDKQQKIETDAVENAYGTRPLSHKEQRPKNRELKQIKQKYTALYRSYLIGASDK